MRNTLLTSFIWIAVLTVAPSHAAAQAGPPAPVAPGETGPRSTPRLVLSGPVPRTPDGKPDLRGFWNAPPLFSSNILEEHLAGFGIQAGKSVVIDPPERKIPYQPWALTQRNENRREENAYLDNEGRCILSGMPRIMLFSFEMKYSESDILLFFDYVHATRIIHMDGRPHLPGNVKLWLGDSIGRWEGDTLVVDTTNLNGKAWFALGGDFMTDTGRIVERFSMPDANTLRWQATITDPKTFTRPWTMLWNAPYVRGTEQEMLDDDCHEGNADLEHLKNNYDAALAAAASPRPAPAATVSNSRAAYLASTGQGAFSGTWHYNLGASGRGSAGISLPSELVIGQTPTELHVDSSTVRQDAISVVYRLDGTEVSVPGPSGITTKARATLEGARLVIDSTRSFPSPAGEVTVDIKDVYSLAGDVLTIERTQTINGISATAKAVYSKASS